MDNTKKVRDFWNNYADGWDDHFTNEFYFINRLYKHLLLIERNKLPPGAKILDIGCGNGNLCEGLQKEGFASYGIDISDTQVEKTRARMSKYLGKSEADHRFRVCDSQEIPDFGFKFDLVSIIDVIVYVPEYATYLKKIQGLLKENGFLLISIYKNRSLYSFAMILRELFLTLRHKNWPERRKNIINLWRTGLWSGGLVNFKTSRQIYSAPHLDSLMRQMNFEKIDEMGFYRVKHLDKDAEKRTKLEKWFARKGAWIYLALYQKQ